MNVNYRKLERNSIVFDPGTTFNVFNDKIPRVRVYSGKEVKIHQLQGHHMHSKYVDTLDFGSGIYFPKGDVSLLSQNKVKQHFKIVFDDNKDEYTLTHRETFDEFIFRPNEDGLYVLMKIKRNDHVRLNFAKAETTDAKKELIWKIHRILAHPSESAMIRSLKSDSFQDYQISSNDIRKARLQTCPFCLVGKMDKRRSRTKPRYDRIDKYTLKPGEHLHVDVVYVKKEDGKQQLYLLFVDEATKFMIAERIRGRDSQTLFQTCSLVAKHFKLPQITIHSDRELGISASRLALFSENINLVQVGAGQHERICENAMRTLRSKFRALLFSFEYDFPQECYPHLFEYVVFVNNLTANKKTGDKLPLEIISGKLFDIRYLNYEFGQLGYFYNANATSSYEQRSNPGILLGWNYESSSVTGLIFKEKRNEIVSTAKFEPTVLETLPLKLKEELSPYSSVSIIDPPKEVRSSMGIIRRDRPHATVELSPVPRAAEVGSRQDSEEALQVNPNISNKVGTTAQHPKRSRMLSCSIDNNRDANISMHSGIATQDENSIRGSDDQKSEYYSPKTSLNDDALTCDAVSHSDEAPTEGQLLKGLRKRKKLDYKALAGLKPEGRVNTAILDPTFEGVKYDYVDYAYLAKANVASRIEIVLLTKDHLDHRKQVQLLKSGETRKAIERELTQMLKHQVFIPIKPSDVINIDKDKLIPSKLFTTKKIGPDGSFIKVKARLVAGGHQEYVDPTNDTFSPTVKPETVTIILNVAAAKDLDIDIMDVDAAFLEASLTKEIYVKLDPHTSKYLCAMKPEYKEFLLENGTIVVKLLKAMYGLKESSKEWYNHLTNILKSHGYIQSLNDSAMLLKDLPDGTKHIVLIYVDDILSVGNAEARENFRKIMRKSFKGITCEENPQVLQYLGMVIRRNRKMRSMFIHQPGFIEEIIKEFGLTKDETSPTPSNERLFDHSKDDVVVDGTKFRSRLMKLMFLSRTRPDIKLTLVYLTTRMQNPTTADELKLLRVAKYLNGTKDLGLYIKPNTLSLYCSADASFASHPDMKGHSGVAISLGDRNAPFHTSSKKQRLVSKSSTEAEIIALESATSELLWSKCVLEELGYPQRTIPIEQDNKSAMVIMRRGPGKMGKSKSIQVKYYWITQKIEDGTIRLEYIPSKMILTDGLTKPLIGASFYAWRRAILNMNDNH